MESKIKLLEELKLKHSDFEIGTDHDDVDNVNKAIDEIKEFKIKEKLKVVLGKLCEKAEVRNIKENADEQMEQTIHN